jgi:MoaA/NifB/PqqE/SkfB family radical SAM enzyme
MWRAFQTMLDRCTTPLFVQVDADMLLVSDAIQRLVTAIQASPPAVAVHVGWLWGDAELRPIQGIKIYRHAIVNQFPYVDSLSCEMPQVEAMRRAGYEVTADPLPADRLGCLGVHYSLQNPEMAFHRWRRLMWKYRRFDYMAWLSPYPARLRGRWLANTSDKIAEAAYLGAVTGLADSSILDTEDDCRQPSQDYRRTAAHLGDWAAGPQEMSLYVTDRCNYRCTFCRRSRPDAIGVQEIDLWPQHAAVLLDVFPTVRSVCIAGFGEPLLHSGLGEIVEGCKHRGCWVSIITNGSLLLNRADEIERWAPNRITVSLNAVQYADHKDRHGGVETWESVLRGIERMANGPVPVGLSFVATAKTIHELPALFRMALNLGVKHIDLPNLLPHAGVDAPSFREQVVTTASTRALATIEAARTAPGAELVGHWPIPIDPASCPRRCESPFVSIGVDARGNFTGCRRLLPPSPEYGHYSQQAVWDHPHFVALRRSMTGDAPLPEHCRWCFGAWGR